MYKSHYLALPCIYLALLHESRCLLSCPTPSPTYSRHSPTLPNLCISRHQCHWTGPSLKGLTTYPDCGPIGRESWMSMCLHKVKFSILRLTFCHLHLSSLQIISSISSHSFFLLPEIHDSNSKYEVTHSDEEDMVNEDYPGLPHWFSMLSEFCHQSSHQPCFLVVVVSLACSVHGVSN